MNKYLSVKLKDLDTNSIKELVGIENCNFNFLMELYHTEITLRDDTLMFFNEDENLFEIFKKHIEFLQLQVLGNNTIDNNLIRQSYLDIVNSNDQSWQNVIAGYTNNGKPLKYKTANQFLISKAIKDNDMIFSIGPAGTGKTYIAVLLACNAFKSDKVKKIILTRPAVEAGESLGFLPGDLKEKVDPYLMPLYDALYEILGNDMVERMIEKNQIEVIPLAYMRGRTLNDAFVILDEAQNTTPGQMLMFLTRLGINSKMIINGDLTQIDLNLSKTKSGLQLAKEKLNDIKGIKFVEFNVSDVVRNRLVEEIIKKYKIEDK